MKVYEGHLLFRTKRPTALIEKIPNANILDSNASGVHAAAVRWDHPHRVPNAQALASLRMKNIPDIADDYVFSSSRQAYTHQVAMMNHNLLHRRSLNLSEMGVGKTSAHIFSSDYLLGNNSAKHKYIDRVIVVAPLSILKAAWENDIYACTPHRSVNIVHGTNRKRLEMLSGRRTDFYVINYDGLTTVEKAVAELTKSGVTAWIIDESTNVKNTATRRWRCINKLIQPGDFVQLLSGSPTIQSPMDAHGQALLVNSSGEIPRSKMAWQVKTMVQVDRYRWISRTNVKSILFDALQPSIRFSKKECLDLPPVTFSERRVALTKQQKKTYTEMQKQFIVEIEESKTGQSKTLTSANAAGMVLKLLQIVTGAAYLNTGEDRETVELDCAPRIRELENVIQESQTKTVVFIPFRATVAMLERHFIEKFGKQYVKTIQGGVSVKERSATVEEFSDKDSPLKLLLCNPQATSHGLSLTTASVAVWFAPPSNHSAETWTQANARLDRPGQTENVSIVRLSGSGIEDQIYRRVEGKVSQQATLLQLYESLIRTPVEEAAQVSR